MNDSQSNVHDKLQPGQVLVITHTRVITKTIQYEGSQARTFVYMTTTPQSQMYTAGDHHDKQYMDDPVFNHLLNWSKSAAGLWRISDLTFGGYFTYPPLPCSLKGFTEMFCGNPLSAPKPSEDFVKNIKNIYVNEQETLSIQGYIVRVQYVPSIVRRKEYVYDESPGAKSLRSHSEYTEANNASSSRTKKSPRKAKSHSRKQSTPSKVEMVTKLLCPTAMYKDLNETKPSYGMQVVNPHIFPRSFGSGNAAFLKQEFSLPFDSLPKQVITGNLNGIPTKYNNGHFIVSLLSLSRAIIIHTVLLIPPDLKYGVTFKDLVTGQTVAADRDTAAGASHQKQNRGNRMTLSEQEISSILESAAVTYSKKRLVCVLNIFSYGCDNVEIALNRAYAT